MSNDYNSRDYSTYSNEESIYDRIDAVNRGEKPKPSKFMSNLIGSLGGKREKLPSQPRNREGYVYLLKAIHDETLFKIGRTSRPDDRKRTFNVKLPFPVEYVCLIKSEDMYALEKELHRKFATKRGDGEWFNLTNDDIDYIKSLATGGAQS